MRTCDLKLDPHPIGTANGELRVSVEVVHVPTGKIIEADAINLRSRISRRRLAETIARQVDDADADRIDRDLLALIPAAEAAAIAPAVGEALPFAKVEPWPEPVAGVELLAALERFIGRYIILPDGAGLAVVAWVVAAWSADRWDRFPYLLAWSPAKRCGKTRLLSALTLVCPRVLSAASISAAALYRAVEQYQPTILIDEAQALTRQGESADALRELLCAGCERTATVLRIGGPDRDTLQRFGVYSPKVLAHIGEADDVLADRSIVVRMERKRPSDHVTPWKSRSVEADGQALASKLARWSQDHGDELADIYDGMQPFALGNDRAAEMWQPLQAVVTAANPERLPDLERSARTLTPGDTDTESVGVRLLAALREVFGGVEFLATEMVLERLHHRDDEPWATWGRQQKPMTAEALSRALRPYKVRPAQSPGKDCRGYYHADLVLVWERYQPVQPVPPVHAAAVSGDRSDGSDGL